MAETLATDQSQNNSTSLWSGDDGEALALFFSELNEVSDSLGLIPTRQYSSLIDTLLRPQVHRPSFGRHPRLHIWGPLEARLQQVNLMILGGLNENSWPAEIPTNPWMSRQMMEKFGISEPERRLGLSAHDFTQAACAEEVMLTRSTRYRGTPTVPSRWLQRLKTYINGTPLEGQLEPDLKLNSILKGLDKPKGYLKPVEPLPTPPLESRPRNISVSKVETWIRDPYSIYASRILKLKPLDPINSGMSAADRGVIIHEILDRFIKKFPKELQKNSYSQLIEIGDQVFNRHVSDRTIRAFWWPRFERIARWFTENEQKNRFDGRIPLSTETFGEITFPSPGGTFTLSARADRIDQMPDGRLAIIDYKTGNVPTKKQIKSGLCPQLSLESAIASEGKFHGIEASEIAMLIYMKLSGGRKPGEESGIFEDVEKVSVDAIKNFKKLVAHFDNQATPYLSRPIPQFVSQAGEYDHLARVKEWLEVNRNDGGYE
tara:strand:- start:112 stop:1575 length:1464 start_codon:yes stop_codon:yes gene_type:complete